MRSTVRSEFVGLFALAFAFASAAAEAPKTPEKMCDPLIALCYRPGDVHFEEAPRGAPFKSAGPPPQWVFASAKDGDATVYVLSGFQKNMADCDAPKCPYVLEPGFGAVVRVQGRKARVLGTPDVALHPAAGEPGPLSDALVQALWRDAAQRFVRAFGGAAAVRAALEAQHIDLKDSSPAFVAALREAGVTPAP